MVGGPLNFIVRLSDFRLWTLDLNLTNLENTELYHSRSEDQDNDKPVYAKKMAGIKVRVN